MVVATTNVGWSIISIIWLLSLSSCTRLIRPLLPYMHCLILRAWERTHSIACWCLLHDIHHPIHFAELNSVVSSKGVTDHQQSCMRSSLNSVHLIRKSRVCQVVCRCVVQRLSTWTNLNHRQPKLPAGTSALKSQRSRHSDCFGEIWLQQSECELVLIEPKGEFVSHPLLVARAKPPAPCVLVVWPGGCVCIWLGACMCLYTNVCVFLWLIDCFKETHTLRAYIVSPSVTKKKTLNTPTHLQPQIIPTKCDYPR